MKACSYLYLLVTGNYSTEEDRDREHQEMRVQRSIISQSIQKDDRSGKSVVDNESILLAATVIATKVYFDDDTHLSVVHENILVLFAFFELLLFVNIFFC